MIIWYDSISKNNCRRVSQLYFSEATILDTEYYIHFAACAFQRGMEQESIHELIKKDGLREDEIFLVILAGKILARDWDKEEDEEPTKPDIKSPIPPKGK